MRLFFVLCATSFCLWSCSPTANSGISSPPSDQVDQAKLLVSEKDSNTLILQKKINFGIDLATGAKTMNWVDPAGVAETITLTECGT